VGADVLSQEHYQLQSMTIEIKDFIDLKSERSD